MWYYYWKVESRWRDDQASAWLGPLKFGLSDVWCCCYHCYCFFLQMSLLVTPHSSASEIPSLIPVTWISFPLPRAPIACSLLTVKPTFIAPLDDVPMDALSSISSVLKKFHHTHLLFLSISLFKIYSFFCFLCSSVSGASVFGTISGFQEWSA